MIKFKKEEFKKIRKNRKLSQRQLAIAIGKSSYRTILRWETGLNIPSEANIRFLADVLSISTNEISNLNDSTTKQLPYYYNELDNLDKSIYDFTTKTESEKQKIFVGLFNRNKMLLWNNQEQERININLRNSINSLNYLIFRKNKALRYTFVNDFFLSYFGISEVNLILGQRNNDIWKSHNAWKELSELEFSVLKTNIPIEDHLLTLPKSFGTNGTGLVSIKPILDESGSLIELIGSIRDISDEQTASDKYFYMESVIEKLEHVIYITKMKPYVHYVYINQAIETVYKVGKNEFYKDVDFWQKFIHKQDKKRVENELKESKTEFIYRIDINNDEIKWIQHFYYHTKLKNEEIIFGVIKDITKSMKNEHIRLIMEATINSMMDTFSITKSSTLETISYSKSREQLYGYTLETMKSGGHNFWLYTCVHPEDRKRMEQYTLTHKWPVVIQFRIIKPPDGEVRWIQTQHTDIMYEGEECWGSIDRDITEQKKKEINRLNKEKKISLKNGAKKATSEIAEKLKKNKVDINTISIATGLSIKQINNL